MLPFVVTSLRATRAVCHSLTGAADYFPWCSSIEDDVWIAANCTITPGTRIGHGAVVGAGAVVTRDVEPYAIVGGVPARVIGSRRKD